MDSNLAKNLEIMAQAMRIAETHGISLKEALNLEIKRMKLHLKELELKASEQEYFTPTQPLKTKLGQEKWHFFMEKLNDCPTTEELFQAYQQAKANGKLRLAKLRFDADFYIRNSDFLGEKSLPAGSLIEVEVYDQQFGQVWLSATECEYMFLDELELL